MSGEGFPFRGTPGDHTLFGFFLLLRFGFRVYTRPVSDADETLGGRHGEARAPEENPPGPLSFSNPKSDLQKYVEEYARQHPDENVIWVSYPPPELK